MWVTLAILHFLTDTHAAGSVVHLFAAGEEYLFMASGRLHVYKVFFAAEGAARNVKHHLTWVSAGEQKSTSWKMRNKKAVCMELENVHEIVLVILVLFIDPVLFFVVNVDSGYRNNTVLLEQHPWQHNNNNII